VLSTFILLLPAYKIFALTIISSPSLAGLKNFMSKPEVVTFVPDGIREYGKNTTVSITFQDGGKGRVSIGGGQFGLDITWKLLGTNKLSTTAKDPGTGQVETEIATLEIAGDTMTIIGMKGGEKEDIYKRTTGESPDSSLFEAAVTGNLEAVKQHIAAGTDLNQVDPNPLGTKGARITNYIGLPGRYLVYLPDASDTFVSRRIKDEAERERLKTILQEQSLWFVYLYQTL